MFLSKVLLDLELENHTHFTEYNHIPHNLNLTLLIHLFFLVLTSLNGLKLY